MKMELHVSVTGNDHAAGTAKQPLKTISEAAKRAMPGDKVIVHEGVYREWVKPQYAGLSDNNRIIYEAAENEKVVIKGSEIIKGWESIGNGTWKVELPNTMFGEFNPYKETIWGDWIVEPVSGTLHLGDVYLNGKSFFETFSIEQVKNPVMRETGVNPPWTKHPEKISNPEQTLYQWYAEVNDETTVIYANFQNYDPNKETVEINVRRSCFYPDKTGKDYITLRGFEIAQAACPWTPPTADQPGMIGANWSKGWIIEGNIIHDAKCSAVSIGKEISTGHNQCTTTRLKPGYMYQMEAVFKALSIGWNKDRIGSHIIRNNVIYDCGQNGIVGHMGCVFSEIYGNHIYNIATKYEWFGYEIAGIKLHAAIDVQIHHNNIHDCSLGTWLDWEACGTRVSSNIYYNNDRDLMVEVTHGPHLIDNNIFASEYNFDNVAEGGAYIHNLCLGTMRRVPVPDRSTPYHVPHSTMVKGTITVFGGDDRWYQNILVGGAETYTKESSVGTASYNGAPTSIDEYIDEINRKGNGDHEVYSEQLQPAYIDRNVYYKNAPAFEKEKVNYTSAFDPQAKVVEEDDDTYLEINMEKGAFDIPTNIMESYDLPLVRMPEIAFEAPDGSNIIFDTDMLGNKRNTTPVSGPIAVLKEGFNKIKIWSK